MIGRYRAIPLFALILLAGCGGGSQDKKADAPVPPVGTLYNNGLDALNAQRYTSAEDQFDSVEQNYPYSAWAQRAELMQGYAQYLQNHYTQAIATIDRYIQLHPNGPDTPYAYYLRALCYYEQITDVQRDQQTTVQAMTALQQVVDRYPTSPYAQDARLKIDLARDHLAGHEMSIGRWYEDQHLYEAALGRFQRVVADFQTTNHVPEALHRMVEIYLRLGMKGPAMRTAAVLGYNYPGSQWYANTYADLYNVGLIKGLPPPRGSSRGFLTRAWDSVF
jgi:outer membrane protein assembly factor BamD